MNGFIGELSGYKVVEDPNLCLSTIIYTKKQTRKFKNTRWVKKYRKNHTKVVLIPLEHVYFSSKHKTITGHPATIHKLKKMIALEENNSSDAPKFGIDFTANFGIDPFKTPRPIYTCCDS